MRPQVVGRYGWCWGWWSDPLPTRHPPRNLSPESKNVFSIPISLGRYLYSVCIITPRVPVRVRQPPGRPIPPQSIHVGHKTPEATPREKARGRQTRQTPATHSMQVCHAMQIKPSQAIPTLRPCVRLSKKPKRPRTRERKMREEGKWETRRGIRRKPADHALPHSDADIKAGGSGASNRISLASLDHDRAPRRASSYGTSAPSSFMRRLNSSRLTQPWNPRP